MGRIPYSSYVYFIQVGDGGPVKIGAAINPERRLEALQTANPATLRIIGLLRTEHPGHDESSLHLALADDRLRGEWFTPSPDVLAYASRASEMGAVLSQWGDDLRGRRGVVLDFLSGRPSLVYAADLADGLAE